MLILLEIYPKLSKQPIKETELLSGPLDPTNEWYAIAKIAEEYQIIPLKDIITKNGNPSSVRNLELHLYRIPKIFEVFSQFTSLQRLNLSKYKLIIAKNRIQKI